MPRAASAPMLPYLKRSISLAHLGSGSSRKNLYQPNQPPATPSTTTMMMQRRMILFVRGLRLMTLEFFQKLDQCVLGVGRKLRAVGATLVTGISIAGQAGVVPEIFP